MSFMSPDGTTHVNPLHFPGGGKSQQRYQICHFKKECPFFFVVCGAFYRKIYFDKNVTTYIFHYSKLVDDSESNLESNFHKSKLNKIINSIIHLSGYN